MGVRYVFVHRGAYLGTDLTEDREELERITRNPGLRLIGNFAAQQCPGTGRMCTEETGEIDVYEVIAE